MHTTDDLRRALADAAPPQSTRLSFADVKRAANRRRHRTFLAGIAVALTPVLAAGGAVALSPAEPGPSPTPDARSTVTPRVLTSAPVSAYPPDPSFPVHAENMVATGLRFGDHEELVLWLDDMVNGVRGGLYDESTGRLRTMSWVGVPTKGFGLIGELDDRHGGILDYGVVGGDGVRVTVAAGGKTADATTAPVPGLAGRTMFWSRRGGVMAGTTAEPNPAVPDAVFTAYGPNGTKLAQSDPSLIQRADTVVNRDDTTKPIGEQMRTGIALPDGGELVLYFDGDEHTALLHAGRRDAGGAVTALKVLTWVSRPPTDPGGFYLGRFTVDGAGVTACIYVGSAARVEMGGEGGGPRGSAAWTAYPRLHVAWVQGVKGNPSAVAYDAAGQVVAATDFR
ncbi:hypothetical protein ACPPVO_40925 [Dactylosporangium sp. McL0621]|uniref:hypothetical protein n=1 Tax=Dactylosporangium sp. McL0621 TaxID=3415678 RepID=UPI003CF37E9C